MKLAEFRKLPLKYTSGIVTGDYARRMYRNEEHGLQVELVTRRKVPGNIYAGWCKGKRYFFLDLDPTEYRSMTALWKAWKARNEQ